MAVTQGSTQLVDLTERLVQQATSAGSARGSVGDKERAFAWSTGLPRGVWDFVQTVTVEGGSFSMLRTSLSATPPAVVPPGGAKPLAVDITSVPVALVKYAGYSKFQLEQSAYSDILPRAVITTLVSGALLAFESACVAKLISGAGTTLTAPTSWPSAVLEGIGAVIGNGGNPDTLVMSPVDLATAVESPSQLSYSGTDPIPMYLGLRLHLSPKIAAGTAVVLDGQAAVVAESSQSPTVIVDSASQSLTNEIRVVADVMAACEVTGPGAVAALTPTLPAALSSKTRK